MDGDDFLWVKKQNRFRITMCQFDQKETTPGSGILRDTSGVLHNIREGGRLVGLAKALVGWWFG